MTTKAFVMIESIRNALAPKFEFPYYALVRVQTKDGTFHLPAPMFNGMSKRSKWAGSLPIAQDKRDGEYFECPFCGERSFFSGVCEDCRRDYEVWEEDEKYLNKKAMEKAAKEELLRRIDAGVDLGIISAEIVLPVAWGTELEPSPFLKCSNYSAQRALDRIEKEIRCHEELNLDYIEGDVITVEGSEELRRQVNGVWQHKHEGYDYWHPMARVHKESMIYPLCEPSNEV